MTRGRRAVGGYSVVGGPAPGASGLAGLAMKSPEGLTAVFVPDAGMVGCSLTDGGDEVLGIRGGMPAYLRRGATFGIPLLAPWANRLGSDTYAAAGKEVSVTGVPGIHRDANGLPIHGLLAAASGWQVTSAGGSDDAADVVARLTFGPDRREYDAFPFSHVLEVAAHLSGRRLSVTTTITPTGDEAVPVAFGWHPYFALPDTPRDEWHIQVPFTRHVVLDARQLPTGEIEEVAPHDGPLGGLSFDDLYAGVRPGDAASVAGGGRRITMTYDEGYDFAVVYAPYGESLIAIEPMTAPTDPFAGRWPIKYATADAPYSARFTVTVDRTSG